jgi:F-type H+-transporting ATPase subunit gamma
MRDTLMEVARVQLEAEHPLMVRRDPVRRVEFLVVTGDRGLCGAFNANVLKAAEVEIRAVEAQIREHRGGLQGFGLTLVGRKAAEFFRKRRPQQVTRTFTGIARVEYRHAAEIAAAVCERFLAGEADQVMLAFSEFVSALTQRPRVVRLLPLAWAQSPDDEPAPPYRIEPEGGALFASLVPKAVEVAVFQALLESQAGEHAARMTAMESATRNTEELIGSLTLKYNRVRQAAITKELVEIVSGAEAL